MNALVALWWPILLSAVVAAVLATQIFGLDPTRARAAAKLVGAVSFIAYGFGTITESIWMARPWSSSAKYLTAGGGRSHPDESLSGRR